MIINEIFSSIDGEARRAGELATFIRATGCPLRCSWCDTKYSWGSDPADQKLTVDEIVEKCKELDNNNITFTGGEPLIQDEADHLIVELADNNFDVSIETCGAVKWSDRPWFNDHMDNVWVCADYKAKSSGMQDKMLPIEEFATLRANDVLKFVVGSRDELEDAYKVSQEIRNLGSDCYIYLSPVFGMIEPKEIVEFMQEKKWQGKVRVQLQLHKFFWDPNKRGV